MSTLGLQMIPKIRSSQFLHPGHCDLSISYGSIVKRSIFGYLLDGSMFFTEEDVEETVGNGKTLQGAEDGILGMCSGDRRSLLLHHSIAYGVKGVPQKVGQR